MQLSNIDYKCPAFSSYNIDHHAFSYHTIDRTLLLSVLLHQATNYRYRQQKTRFLAYSIFGTKTKMWIDIYVDRQLCVLKTNTVSVCRLIYLIWQVLQDWSMLKVTICGPYALSLRPGTRLPCLCLCLKWHVSFNHVPFALFLAFGNKRIAICWGVERSSSSPPLSRGSLHGRSLTIIFTERNVE